MSKNEEREEGNSESLSKWIAKLGQLYREKVGPEIAATADGYDESSAWAQKARKLEPDTQAILHLYRYAMSIQIWQGRDTIFLLDVMYHLAKGMEQIGVARLDAEKARKLAEEHEEIIERIKDLYRQQLETAKKLIGPYVT